MTSVPAWKRIGLQVKQELEEDPLAITAHLESDRVTNKELKKINKQKRKLEELKSSGKTKKPPKRVKLPKAERAPPPEKDQLAYLRQYQNDRDNWKFSKQKQNWLLKNIAIIPQDYESALIVYLEGLQGASRTRLLEELKLVVTKWNKVIEDAEEKVEAELNGTKEEDKDDAKEKETKETAKDKTEKEDEAPDQAYAVRCAKLIFALSDEKVELKGVEQEVEEEEEKEDQKPKEQEEPENEETTPPPRSLHNLIIEEVETGYLQPGDDVIETPTPEPELPKPKSKKEKKHKKDKKKKKKSKA